jgi:serine O-acetyltransferase
MAMQALPNTAAWRSRSSTPAGTQPLSANADALAPDVSALVRADWELEEQKFKFIRGEDCQMGMACMGEKWARAVIVQALGVYRGGSMQAPGPGDTPCVFFRIGTVALTLCGVDHRTFREVGSEFTRISAAGPRPPSRSPPRAYSPGGGQGTSGTLIPRLRSKPTKKDKVLTLMWATRGQLAAASDPDSDILLEQTREVARREPLALAILALSLEGALTDGDLIAAVLASSLSGASERADALGIAREVFRNDRGAAAASLQDVAVTTAKNFEPGGQIATLLFSRGIHAILAHRVAHSLWRSERRELALAVKTAFGRVFSTDIHPGATFGRGIWLDHGVGFVVGETSVVEDDVAIWHGVTLGSTLKQDGDSRHPRLRRGCTIGASCVILGDIDIGEGSVVAAGSVVLADVPPCTTVAGVPAKPKVRSASSFAGF